VEQSGVYRAGKVKVKLSLCLTNYAMKAYVGVYVLIYIFLTSTLAEDEWSASRLGHFIPGERASVHIGYEVGWTPEPVWTAWRRENS
jgi:hypothetical protein